MKISEVKNSQAFTAGNIIFVDKLGKKADKLSEYLPEKLGEHLPFVEKLMEGKPYDLFVRHSDIDGFISVDANVDYINLISRVTDAKAIPGLMLETRPDRFDNAAVQAMRNFENLPNYKDIVEPKVSFFRELFNSIFKRNKSI